MKLNALEKAKMEDTKANIAKGRFSKKQIDDIFRYFGVEIEHKTEYEVTRFLLNVFAVALHDQCGFGKQRIEKVINKVKSELECYDKELITVEDFESILLEECDYKIKIMFS